MQNNILALISDLYGQITALQQENDELRQALTVPSEHEGKASP